MFVSLPKNSQKREKKKDFLHVSGQLLPFNGQSDLLSHLRDHSAIFAGFWDDFDTLEMSRELYMMIGKHL